MSNYFDHCRVQMKSPDKDKLLEICHKVRDIIEIHGKHNHRA